MDSRKEVYIERPHTSSLSSVKNTFWLFVAVCLSGCTQVTWTTSNYSGPCLWYWSLSDLEKDHKKSAIWDSHDLEKLGQFIGAKKEGRNDEFEDDEGNVFTREQLESSDK